MANELNGSNQFSLARRDLSKRRQPPPTVDAPGTHKSIARPTCLACGRKNKSAGASGGGSLGIFTPTGFGDKEADKAIIAVLVHNLHQTGLAGAENKLR